MLTLLFVLIVLGVLAWWIGTLPMPAPFRNGIYVVMVLIVVYLVFHLFGGALSIPLR